MRNFAPQMEKDMQSYRLSDLVKIKNGKGHKMLSNGKYPVLGSGGIMCNSFRRNGLGKWRMGRMLCLTVHRITDSRNEFGYHYLNRSLCYICMDHTNDTKSNKNAE